MPHCIIEYTEGVETLVDIDELVAATHAGALAADLFPEYDIKTRALGYRHHRTGATQDSYVHVTVRLLSGRDDRQKAALAESVLAAITPLLPGVVSVGVEIVDMHRDSYRKRVL